MSTYRNAKITPEHVKHVVRECWTLYNRFQETEDEYLRRQYCYQYEDQRVLAERAISALPEDWQRKEFVLP
jgi:hypothetical protein